MECAVVLRPLGYAVIFGSAVPVCMSLYRPATAVVIHAWTHI